MDCHSSEIRYIDIDFVMVLKANAFVSAGWQGLCMRCDNLIMRTDQF